MKKMRRFFNESNNIERDSYIWNMVGVMLMTFQSVILLMILVRTVGITAAGIYTIANADSNLFLNIGKYGMRYFQVSDVEREYTFREYKRSRVVTSVAMMVVSTVYLLYTASQNGYSQEKVLIIWWMCLFKVVDAAEDIYIGNFQQKNRLDIGGKIMTTRMFLTITVYAVSVVISRNLLFSTILSTVVTAGIFLILREITYAPIRPSSERMDGKNVLKILQACFPLFVGAFLSFYIGNAPKYAIDAILSDELQAVYGFISMPVFAVGLLNNFIFNPILHEMSVLWEKRHVIKFVKKTMWQGFVVMCMTAVCIGGAYLLGIPVLSVIYSTNLTPYRSELLVLLLGGGFLALSGLLNAVITIIRFQQSLMWSYLVVTLLAFFFSNRVVARYGIMGAASLYTLLMAALCIIFIAVLVFGIRKRSKENM